MKLVISSDHAGFPLKEEVRAYLAKAGHEVVDLGAYKVDPLDDYPDFAEKVGLAIKAGAAPRGVLICGSGVGVCVAANKIPGIRAATCHDTCSAHSGVEYDDMNVLVIGSRIVGEKLAEELVKSFLSAQFTGAARHLRRLNKIKALEARTFVEPAKT